MSHTCNMQSKGNGLWVTIIMIIIILMMLWLMVNYTNTHGFLSKKVVVVVFSSAGVLPPYL